MTSVSILIPWWPGDPWRARVWDVCRRAWTDDCRRYGMQLVVGSGDSVASAVNDAARHATGDVVAIYGADCVPDSVLPGPLLDVGPWAPIYAETAYHSRRNTEALMRGDVGGMRDVVTTVPACTGVLAVRREVWDDLGGMDERFHGWGWEDTALRAALATLYPPEPAPLLFAPCLCLWHDEGHRDLSDANPNRQLYEREYVPAIGRPDAMREVIGRE